MEVFAAGSTRFPLGAQSEGAAHFRDYDIVIVTVQGSACYRFNGHDIDVAAGDILFLPRGIDFHQWRTTSDEWWVVRWLRVQLGPGEGALFDYPRHPSGACRLAAPSELIERLKPLLRRLTQLHPHDDPHSVILRDCFAKALLYEIRAFFGPPQSPHDAAIANVLALIDRRLDDPDLALGDLVRAAGSSRSAFVEHFATVVGQPPMRFVEERRMQTAARRLRTADSEVIAAIAREVGYGSPQYFSTRFRKRFGCSPRAYRSGAESQEQG